MQNSPVEKSAFLTAEAHCARGDSLYAEGKAQEAIHAYEEAILQNPCSHRAYAGLGETFIGNLHVFEAIECYGLAIEHGPEHIEYKEALLSLVQFFQIKKHNPKLMEIITLCLETEGLDCSHIGMIWHTLLKLDPDFKPLYKATHQKAYPFFKKTLLKAKQQEELIKPFFITGLLKTTVFNFDYEHFLTGLRHVLLDSLLENGGLTLTNEELTALGVALSRYCFFTEYIFDYSKEEQEKINALQKDIETGQRPSDDLQALSILACYMPLNQLKNAEALKDTLLSSPLTELMARTQLEEPLTLAKTIQSIESITKVENETSEKVREQYEAFPYPRWSSYSKTIHSEQAEGFLKDKEADILVAGCRTGKEVIELATVFPRARITAIDLSKTSLAYSIEKAKLYGIENITFGQADILKLGETGKQYDYIASSGVLHHMKDPMEGWSILVDLLKPGGTMRIALYSEQARKGVVKARSVIAENDYTNDIKGIRKFRREAPTLMNKHDIDSIKKFRDYYTTSECRDLLFHVQEHRFDLLQIKACLDKLGLNFSCFYLAKDFFDLYKKDYPDDTEAINLENWAKFEEKHPDTFANMYQFWCRKEK